MSSSNFLFRASANRTELEQLITRRRALFVKLNINVFCCLTECATSGAREFEVVGECCVSAYGHEVKLQTLGAAR